MRGHRHDRAGAVAHEHVVGDEHRHVPAVGGVLGERAGEHARLLAAFGLTFQLRLLRRELAVGRHRLRGELVEAERGPPLERRVGRPLVGDDRVDQRVLGREHHVGGAEERVGAGGEHGDLDALVLLDRERDLGTDAAADPVALHQLDRLRPVEQVEVGEQAIGVGGDAQHPLRERSPEHRVVAAVATAVGGDLFVGQHRAERGAPVHERVVEVREPVAVDDRASRLHAAELVAHGDQCVGVGWRRSGCAGAVLLELDQQLVDRAGAVLRLVVPGAVELEEDPLGPPVVVDVGGRGSATRIVTEAQRAHLALHVRDVRLGGDARVLARLHRVLLRGEPERVVAHRVEHVAALHPHEPRVDVGADVPEGLAHVEAGAARVREHVEHVELAALRHLGEAAGEVTGGVRGPEGAVGVPAVLPLRLDLVGERGVVRRWHFGRCLGRGAFDVAHDGASVPGRRSRDRRWYRGHPSRGCSSVGRALPWHGRGQGFESPQLHSVISRRHRKHLEPSSFRFWWLGAGWSAEGLGSLLGRVDDQGADEFAGRAVDDAAWRGRGRARSRGCGGVRRRGRCGACGR